MNTSKDRAPGGGMGDRSLVEYTLIRMGPELTGIVVKAGELLQGKHGHISDSMRGVLDSIREHAIKANALRIGMYK